MELAKIPKPSTITTMQISKNTATTPTSHFDTVFCLQMANHVLLQESLKNGSNFVISPLSFHVLLSLIAAGSKGHTLEQLLFFLRSRNVEDLILHSSAMIEVALPAAVDDEGKNLAGGPILSFINGAWIREGLKMKSSFEEIVREVYKAVAKEVDFENKSDEVIDEINSWAEKATKGLIKNLLPKDCLKGIEEKTRLILANALYFKGSWAKKFDVSSTQHRGFHLLNGQTVQVPFMTIYPALHLYNSFDGYRILKIPYQNGQNTRLFSMYFFLPDAADGLQSLATRFNSIPGFFSQEYKLSHEMLTDFWIPKFKFSFEFEASNSLMELGLHLPFHDVGEITEMVHSPRGLFVKKMYHKSFIEVNEEGTEAAASTAAILIQECARYPTPSFVADHPFMFMIREEKSRIVFFLGAVLNPLSES